MKTHKSIILQFFLFAFFIIIGFSGCRNAEKPAQISDESSFDDSLLTNSNIVYLLPSPNEIINIIFKDKIAYKPQYCLKVTSGSNIVNSNFQALILGVYISDFSYSLINNDLNQSTTYLEVIKSLSDNIGIGGMFNEKFFSRVDRNLNNIDSLNKIYADISKNTFTILASAGSNELLSVISMGVSLESIYLGYNVYKTEPFDKSMVRFFVEQRMVFENFYQNYVNYNSNKNDLKGFNRDLNSFYRLFRLNIGLVVDKNIVSKNDTLVSLDVKYNVRTNTESMNNLGKSIIRLRENLVGLSYQ